MSNAQVVFLSEPLTFRSFQVWPRSLFKEKMAAMLVTRDPLKLPEFLSTSQAIPWGFPADRLLEDPLDSRGP